MLKVDADGLVYDAVPVEGFSSYKSVYADNSGEVIYVTDNGLEKTYTVADDAIVWVIDNANGKAAVGSADDATKGAHVVIKVTNDPVVEKMFVFKTIEE